MGMKKLHKHHIVPIYRCKELNIDPNFKENLVNVTRYQHAVIHWGYYCKNLTELKKHCNPPQWVLDMIPLGNVRDAGAAKLISLNEIDQISLKGIKLTEEHKRKIGLANKGRKLTDEHKAKIVGWGRKQPQSQKDKVRDKVSKEYIITYQGKTFEIKNLRAFAIVFHLFRTSNAMKTLPKKFHVQNLL